MLGKKFIVHHRAGSLLTLYCLICFVCLAFSSRSFVLRPRDLGLSVFSFFQEGLSSAGSFFTETVDSIRVLGEMKKDYEAALEKLQRYEQVEMDLLVLREENRRLSEALAFSGGMTFSNIPAKIIGKDPQNYHSTITLNKGSLAGVEKDMSVVGIQSGHQGLVGKITRVGLSASILQPIFDPNSFVAARLLSSRYEGLVNGLGADTILMRYVKRYARPEIHYGDVVVTSGMGTSIFPSGIEIGSVKSISARSYDTSLELEIEPVIDFSRIEYVYILKPEAAEKDKELDGAGESGAPGETGE